MLAVGVLLVNVLPAPLKSVPLGPSHIYLVVPPATTGTFILLTNVPLHANCGKLLMGGTTTLDVGGAVLIAPTLNVLVVEQPLPSVTVMAYGPKHTAIGPKPWFKLKSPSVLKFEPSSYKYVPAPVPPLANANIAPSHILLVPQQLTLVTVPPKVGLAFIMAVTLPLAVHKNWLVNTTVYTPALPEAALLVTVGVCWLLVNGKLALVVQLYVVV